MLETGKERLLIFAPHADDEVLGCGGFIEKACRLGNTVKVVIAAVGETEFCHNQAMITSATRINELTIALHHLGCSDFEVLYDDKEALLDTLPKKELISKVDHLLMSFHPSIVLFPYPSFHQDHQALFNACMAGLRPVPGRQYKLIAMFEYPFIVWQYPKLRDTGDIYLDISQTIDKKIEALQKHTSQLRQPDHLISPEKVKKWAEMRGMEIGVRYAEKFHLIRAAF